MYKQGLTTNALMFFFPPQFFITTFQVDEDL